MWKPHGGTIWGNPYGELPLLESYWVPLSGTNTDPNWGNRSRTPLCAPFWGTPLWNPVRKTACGSYTLWDIWEATFRDFCGHPYVASPLVANSLAPHVTPSGSPSLVPTADTHIENPSGAFRLGDPAVEPHLEDPFCGEPNSDNPIWATPPRYHSEGHIWGTAFVPALGHPLCGIPTTSAGRQLEPTSGDSLGEPICGIHSGGTLWGKHPAVPIW